MSKRTGIALAVLAAAAVSLLAVFAGAGSASSAKTPKGKPIVIGAAVDLTKNMAPFDAPALLAAQIEIKKINAAGGVLGRPLKLEFVNDQLDPQKTKQAAVQFVQKHVDIGWVTCDFSEFTRLTTLLIVLSPCVNDSWATILPPSCWKRTLNALQTSWK